MAIIRITPRKGSLFLGVCLLLTIFAFSLPSYSQQNIRVGAQRTELYLPLLKGKNVAIVGNQTSQVQRNVLLPEYLISKGIKVVRLFSPEHGFRGTYDAGKSVTSSVDTVTKLPITSLYGNKKRPSRKDLDGIDILLFDLQDVGTRFYTYISTMHYVMEACNECSIPVVILDRPNPNDYVDGPLLEADCKSFIGMHPIPLLHGLTIGELALMINGEGWLQKKDKINEVTVIPIEGWKHGQPYSITTPPSPNLRTNWAIHLYPSLCLFEATIMSVGRGTDNPFTCIGYPDKRFGKYTFVPKPQLGALQPKYRDKTCYGERFDSNSMKGFNLAVFIRYYKQAEKLGYNLVERKRTFELLVGNKRLLQQIVQGKSEQEIRASWKTDLNNYRKLRQKYLLYPSVDS